MKWTPKQVSYPNNPEWQREMRERMRGRLAKLPQNQVWDTSNKVQTLIESPDSLDIAERKKTLANYTWMNDDQKAQIEITEKGIKIAWIGLALNDEEKEMNFEAAKTLAPSNDNWNTILETIGWNRQQKLQFFRQILKMEKMYYWSSSLNNSGGAHGLKLHEFVVITNLWNVKLNRFSVRSLKNF